MHRKFFSVDIPIILTVASIICHIDLKSLGITGFSVCGHNFIIIVRSPHPKFDVQKDLVDIWKFEIRFVVLFLSLVAVATHRKHEKSSVRRVLMSHGAHKQEE
jgi:hypothetical protein